MSPSRILSGKELGFPYSFSRWTDVPAAKWEWFKEVLSKGQMSGPDPRSGAPKDWSLRPEDTLGMVFWTKDPTNLLREPSLLSGYKIRIHVTVTGWEEVEEGAPNLWEGSLLLQSTVRRFGTESVIWRFTPIPMVRDVLGRFQILLNRAASVGLRSVYLSFLQNNDLMPETRSAEERRFILQQLAIVAEKRGVEARLCNEDKLLLGHPEVHPNLKSSVCAPPSDFALPERGVPSSEGCGCSLMVDHFTVNEDCTMKCLYCYSGDKNLSPSKRDTTRRLPLVL